MKRLAIAVCFVALAGGVSAGAAGAATTVTFADACGSANNLDYAVCERVDYLDQQVSGIDSDLNLIWWGVWIVAGLVTVRLVQPYWDRVWSWSRIGQ